MNGLSSVTLGRPLPADTLRNLGAGPAAEG